MDGHEVRTCIHIGHLTKVFGEGSRIVRALDDFGLDVGDGEFVCLLGPSGCGKTTVLRIVAGLEVKTSGVVSVHGRNVGSAGSDRGMVFQEFALFPWRTVRKNIEFGLEMKGIPEAEMQKNSSKLIDLVGLKGVEE